MPLLMKIKLGDQCEKCGKTLDQLTKNIKSIRDNSTPVFKTTHKFIS